MKKIWWRRGDQHELRSEDGRLCWAVITRKCPYWKVRLLRGPGSPIKKAATLRAAQEIAQDWAMDKV